MKPHLRREYGIWVCRAVLLTFRGPVRIVGDGYSPMEAYREWQQQLRRCFVA